MLWTEKYRPQELNELIGQDKFVTDAQYWQKGMPNLLLYGDAGVGKTAAAGVLANFILGENKNGNFFEINASDDRRLEVVRTTIKEIATSMKVGNVPHKIILLDEMDGMTPDAQRPLKRLMERYSGNVRFIITSNHKHKIILPLQSRCANYHFTPLTQSEIRSVLVSILQKEGIAPIHNKELGTFISGLQGDLRRGITEVQASIASDTPLSIQIDEMQKPYNDLMDSISNNQYESALHQTHDLIYLSVDMKTLCQNLHDIILTRDIDYNLKFKYLRIIGEAEWRSTNMTPKVLASWMIGQMI